GTSSSENKYGNPNAILQIPETFYNALASVPITVPENENGDEYIYKNKDTGLIKTKKITMNMQYIYDWMFNSDLNIHGFKDVNKQDKLIISKNKLTYEECLQKYGGEPKVE
ncbi:MAG: hypothetical protein ACP5RZ_06380, partial [Thermoplasmata archaeon]